MLKAAKTMAATAAAWAATMAWKAAAIAGEAAGTAAAAAPSCGGFGGGGGGGAPAADGAAGAPQGAGWQELLLPLAIFALIFYFFIIRPQKKRQKQQDSLINGISKGDQVITIGGFFGTVQEVRDDSFVIELSKEVRVRILKSAVSTKRVPSQTPPPAQIEDK